ncbi:fumarylacetoacetate hydrolase [Cohnella sp. CFH 77786]|uniref:fumarylacetoacetate hydrolase family protein n=1 Tax=Cohnella sp. CFH 77786 TaxID=2662265 RepID=UPI001C60B4A8|nr:fumarylacetoacetate hydrolase family protein [Cohnella sp. CFH 77786]MBW5445268.1 fumarylacetoacetate hydrolase [Cohnella sp. CFH 77786]
MRIFRYRDSGGLILGVMADDGSAFKLDEPDLITLWKAARAQGVMLSEFVAERIAESVPLSRQAESLDLAMPVDAPEVWAAGVTYERSRQARNYEATSGRLNADTFYDKVYEAERPELFLKSTAARTVGPGEQVCLRSDSAWQVPEAELGLVLDRDGTIIGYTAGNDMSCRDIEGENPLYLPQAKIWKRSCAIGPFIRLADTVADPYALAVSCRIYRGGVKMFDETANTGMLKRKLDELIVFLKRDNELFDGTVLLTGTCLVPPNQFTLKSGDRIEIEVETIGTLVNTAVNVHELDTASVAL